MKHLSILSKVILAIAVFMSAVVLSCHEKTETIQPKDGVSYVKLLFNYSDGTSDQSRIMKLVHKPDGGRTSGNITINSTITLTEGNYGVAEIQNGADLTIDGEVTFGNLNPNNTHAVKVTITKNGKLTIGSSLNQNGKFVFYNYGTLVTGNHEMQSGNNDFYNYGKHKVNGDLQITSGDSKYSNCGVLEVSNYTNIHSGQYHACDCGSLTTNGLNINGSKKVTGKGFIKVTGNLNLNGFMTESPDIEFCYNGHINQPDKLGSAKRTCEPSCSPNPMPVRFDKLTVSVVESESGSQKGRISFEVTENSGLLNMQILLSSDARTWRSVFTEDNPSAFVVGKKYSQVFNLK